MNRILSIRSAALLFSIPALFLFGGCAGPAPEAPKARLVQLNDYDWTDLSDVKEIHLYVANRAEIDRGAVPFEIAIWHRGATDNPFQFSFTDASAAYDAYKRLVDRLGGRLHETDWKPATDAPVAEKTPAPPQSLFQNNNGASAGSYSAVRRDLNELTACRDEKLITDIEFQRGHDAAVANFAFALGNGSAYQGDFEQLHGELSQLEKLKTEHLLSDDNITSVRTAIISRYIPAREK